MKVLLAHTEPERARILEAHLASAGVTETVRPQPGESLTGAIARTTPGLVVVAIARPDRDMLDGIRLAAHRDPCPVAIFVDVVAPTFMEAAVEASVRSYTVVGAAIGAGCAIRVI